ncbi:MAG: glycosyltransferase [Acidobacteria bacterium]|nr:glycosyltransferase [Acidobacteriota bacterium]
MRPISLVIPIRNEETSIKQLVESITQQTLVPDEVILVDGGSNRRNR